MARDFFFTPEDLKKFKVNCDVCGELVAATFCINLHASFRYIDNRESGISAIDLNVCTECAKKVRADLVKSLS